MILGVEALAGLKQGNQRFISDVRSSRKPPSASDRFELGEQKPFAVILGCSDSRVPVEIIFDQGLGDLFVIRVAGNIIAPSLVGSVEFAAERFDTKLVEVPGHTHPVAPSKPRWNFCKIPARIIPAAGLPSSGACARRWKSCSPPI